MGPAAPGLAVRYPPLEATDDRDAAKPGAGERAVCTVEFFAGFATIICYAGTTLWRALIILAVPSVSLSLSTRLRLVAADTILPADPRLACAVPTVAGPDIGGSRWRELDLAFICYTL